ncbi:uncharacterized protein LOC128869858 [Anastrepha ludens]|uniref:uncharacterized protein LOC128869858 n=1 Tax=Anastrepha ludens TaxID=28586 RepID=UPI0023B125A7|nr:uncharacterized protein LOC128869858 [Anastrepha ludens]
MKNIIDPICRGLSEKSNKPFTLNSRSCKCVLKQVANNTREEVKKELNKRLISLKIDSASRLSRNIFALSAQYINNYNIQSRILGMVELKGVASSSSRNIAAEIMKILSKYGVGLNQVVSITSDNGANMIKSSKILSHCSVLKEDRDDVDEANDVYLKNIEMFNDTLKIQMGDIEICRCAAHTAQLCALDSTKDPVIKSYLMNCRNLTKYIKKNSNGYREIFELKKLALPQLDCPTRWGSTYNMIKNIYNSKDVLVNIESVKNKSQDENFELNDDLWAFIKSYYTVFEPLQKTIIKFQAEALHYGDFYAQWLRCKLLTEKILQTHDDSLSHTIGKNLLRNIEIRTSKLLTNDSLNACLFLDPRFNHTLTADKRADAITYLKKLYDRLKEMGCIKSDKTNSFNNTSVRLNEEHREDEDEYINAYLCQNLEARNDDDIDVYSKIENLKLSFQRISTNVLEFWKERQFADPELYALTNICFAVPPTQVTIERAFSSLKLILTDNRNRLGQDMLEDILIVKLNPMYLDKAVNELSLFEDMDGIMDSVD